MAWMARSGEHDLAGGEYESETSHRPTAFTMRDDRPTLLVAGPSLGRTALTDWATRAGLRCIGECDLDMLPQRLSRTVAVDFVLVDLRHTDLTMGDMAALALRPEAPDADLLILTDLHSVDLALAHFDDRCTQMVCEPSTGEIIHMMVCAALAAEREAGSSRVYDSARPDEGARIGLLCEEVRRLAGTVDHLTGQGFATSGKMSADEAAVAEICAHHQPDPPTPDEIRAVLRARRMRDRFFASELFADPAWDMMLDLMAARLSGERVCVSSLCIAAAVPPTTALRWIRQLTERTIFARVDDKTDGRRVFIELTDMAAEAVAAWIAAVRRHGGLLLPVAID